MSFPDHLKVVQNGWSGKCNGSLGHFEAILVLFGGFAKTEMGCSPTNQTTPKMGKHSFSEPGSLWSAGAWCVSLVMHGNTPCCPHLYLGRGG